MFPWEHVAFGYLCYSLLAHLAGRSPSDAAAVAVVAATLGPDLVDKTLSWVLEIFPQGYSVGHSIFVAGILSTVVFAVAAKRNRPFVGVAFGVAYLSHLFGDVVYPVVFGDPISAKKILWPLVTLPPYENDISALDRFLYYTDRYLEQLVALEPSPFLLAELAFLFVAFLVWVYDGVPILSALWSWVKPDRDEPGERPA
ncbi:metal-dependent hydrolase [Halorussus halophilus]|uniref:metal-dependent hydrolase n=1 Tax=Halorussus halophilus TaxID=2650975 RepID=UPI0013012284|nr:metal-dependent hydrolase [Halorussus halophilus]